MSDKKKFIEAEIVDEKIEKTKKNMETDFSAMEGQIKDIKKAILLKGISALVLPVLIIIIVLTLIFGLIFLLFAHPFDYILTAILGFYILKLIYKIIKLFKLK